jgi:NADH-quinone oxidoreductase subunit C
LPVDQSSVVEHVQSKFPAAFQRVGEHMGQKWIEVERGAIVEVLTSLRDEQGFEFLMDLTAVDWLGREPGTAPDRFSMVYELYNPAANVYIRVKAWLPGTDPEIHTVSALWKCATWAEREVWDMFGIRFEGLQDHRRILMPNDYTGHPLRKDYPLTGRGERSNFPRYVK